MTEEISCAITGIQTPCKPRLGRDVTGYSGTNEWAITTLTSCVEKSRGVAEKVLGCQRVLRRGAGCLGKS